MWSSAFELTPFWMEKNLIFDLVRRYLFFILTLSLVCFANAQRKPLRMGLGMIGTAYQGDLNVDGTEFYRFYPGAHLTFEFASHKRLTTSLCGGYGRMVAQDRDLQPVDGIQPNIFASTNYFYADFRLKFRFRRDRKLIPYVSVGGGFLNYTPRDAEGNALADNFSTRKDGEEYGSITATLPLSAGIEYNFSKLLAVSVEYTHRRTTTDYLDNIGELGLREGKDHLNTLSLNIHITFDPENPILWMDHKGRDR